MKHTLLFILTLILVPLFLGACSGIRGQTFRIDEQMFLTSPDGSSDYTLIHGENAEQWELDAAAEFRERFEKLTGCSLKITGDYIQAGIHPRFGSEIRIGKTNRDAEDLRIARHSLRKGGYIVRAASGEIVIDACDAEGMQNALDFFFDSVNETKMKNRSVYSIPLFLRQICLRHNAHAEKDVYKPVNYADMKGIWLSQFDMADVYSDGTRQRPEAEYRTLLRSMLNRISDMGFNTVFVQVRPYADSIYPSALYPPSACAVGSYGNAVEYDPFAILIEMAHEKKLSVHAWINPLRCMTEKEIGSITSEYAIGRWYRDIRKNGTYLVVCNQRYYLNPAYSQVRDLIIAGVVEIVSTYPVDGIHMDDYFYPTTDEAFDRSAYAAYKRQNEPISLGDFRREQINRLVAGLYRAIKSVSNEVLFGISPAGSAEDTYQNLYADVYAWCSQSGYVDYICPQIYWGMEHQTCDFRSVCRKWQDMLQCDSVRLIIGMTLTKAVSGTDSYAGSGRNEWSLRKDIIRRCIEYTGTLSSCSGIALFSYSCCYDVLTGEERSESAEERAGFVPLLKVYSWKNAKSEIPVSSSGTRD